VKPIFRSKLTPRPRHSLLQVLHPLSKARRRAVGVEFQQMIDEYQRVHPYWEFSPTFLAYLDYLNS
jgi:hypothetical protein